MKYVFERIRSASMLFFIKPIANKIVESVETSYLNPEIKLHMDYLENELGKSQFFAGDELTAADILLIKNNNNIKIEAKEK